MEGLLSKGPTSSSFESFTSVGVVSLCLSDVETEVQFVGVKPVYMEVRFGTI